MLFTLIKVFKNQYIFLLLLIPSLLFSQVDQRDYSKEIEKFNNTNLDSLLYFSKLEQKSINKCIRFHGIVSEAGYHYKNGDYKKSEELCLEVYTKLENVQLQCEVKSKINALNRLFWIKKNQNKFEEAFYYMTEKQKAVEQLPKNNSYYYIHKLSGDNSLAIIKGVLGHHEEAIEILSNNTKVFDKLSFDKTDRYYNSILLNQSSSLNLIGTSYFNLAKDSILNFLDSADVYYKKAFYVSKKIAPALKNSDDLYNLRRVKVLIARKEFEKAEIILDLFYGDVKNYQIAQEVEFFKAIVYRCLKKTKLSILYAKTYLKNTKTSPSSSKNRVIIYDILSRQYKLTKQSDSAFKYSELALTEINTFNESKTATNKSHYLYDLEKIKKRNEETIEKASSSRNIIILFYTGAIILLLSWIFLSYRNKKQLALQYETIQHKYDAINTPKTKDYPIEKELEIKILGRLQEVEDSTLFVNKEFSLSWLASKLGTNTSYLSFIINKNKGQTFKQYLTKLRIDYLLHKLNTEKQFRKYSIQSLGEEIGYTNASAFTRAFKKHLQVTPSEYINLLEQKNLS